MFNSFDGGVTLEGNVFQPERYRDLEKISDQGNFIVRGAGFSYAAASFASESTTVLSCSFNRILGFDATTGLVEIEAGITLAELYNFLLPKGFYLPIQPGFGGITVGGCIAADVHGKNQLKDGNFHNLVMQLMIFHPSHGFLTLSREADPEVFELTCGGFGLTGFIVSCVLKASPIPSSFVAKRVLKFDNWKEGIKLFETESQKSDFINSWHDYSSNSSIGKSGLLFSSKFVLLDEIELKNEKDLRQVPKQEIGFVNHPFNLYNKFGLKLLNTAYKLQSTNAHIPSRYSLENALFPIHKTKIYFAGYGKSGFHEYQVILPKQAVESFMNDIVCEAKKSDMPLPLISGKLFGGDQKLLRFMGEGYAIAINFPRNNRSEKFAELLDEKTLCYQGRPNLIKDSRLPREVLEATYTETDEFRKKLRDFDPKRLVVSEFSQRLGL